MTQVPSNQWTPGMKSPNPKGRPPGPSKQQKLLNRMLEEAGEVMDAVLAKAKEGDFSYPGHWLRAEIGYVTPYIDRWEWQDGKKVPIYKHGQVAGTSFFARWK